MAEGDLGENILGRKIDNLNSCRWNWIISLNSKTLFLKVGCFCWLGCQSLILFVTTCLRGMEWCTWRGFTEPRSGRFWRGIGFLRILIFRRWMKLEQWIIPKWEFHKLIKLYLYWIEMHLENVDFELKVPLRDKYNKIFYRIGWEKDLKNRKTNQ